MPSRSRLPLRLPARLDRRAWIALASLALVGTGAQAQSVVMSGSYQNFDVLNDTGHETEGFEMEVHGVSSSQLTRIFGANVIRYGMGTATDFPGGVYVRWIAPWDPNSQHFTTATPIPVNMTSVPGESCWTGGMGNAYFSAGCEHFGISAVANPTSIVYRWLLADPANPGFVTPSATPVALPAPIWTANPPAQPGLPGVVVAEVNALPAPPAQFGDAQWVKVYKTEQAAPVKLDDLMGDNHAVVPENANEVETPWALLQQDPGDGGRKRQRGKLVNQGNLGKGNHAVVRRYEYYKYAGAYDPITHEALCADLACAAPSPGELGDAIGAQNAAADIATTALSVAVSGSGSVASTDKVFACPNKCYGIYTPGATVTLTAKPASGASFLSWGGACAGNATTCKVTINADTNVTANFSTKGGGGGGGSTFKLTVSKANTGTVTSTPAGISCGTTCSAKYAPATQVTLTATAPAGKTFVGWTGACIGAQPTCTVTMNANVATKASFSK